LNGWFIDAGINKFVGDEVTEYVSANSDLVIAGMMSTLPDGIGLAGRRMMFFLGRVGYGFSENYCKQWNSQSTNTRCIWQAADISQPP